MRPTNSTGRSWPQRFPPVVRRRRVLLMVFTFLAGLLIVPLSGRPAAAQSGWRWYKTDTHVHSAFSDGGADVGILSHQARALGYDALFLTDHDASSSYPLASPNLTANHWVFEDGYTQWRRGTFGTLSASTNALVSSPVRTGSKALRLSSSAAGSAETHIWARRGPNLRSGPITLQFSVYPTRIDPGSGIYVSVSIGGDPRITGKPLGYTTSAGVVSPGKTIVLVWQLGEARAPSSDPNARVLTHTLEPYTLNAWNSYTIDVSAALEAIPEAERPLDYNGLTHLKLAAAANGGTADAYFDSYSLDAGAPVAPADEFVYRTSRVDDFDSATFRVFPGLEMGLNMHAQRFNFAISDAAQHRSYLNGAEGGIADTQQSGYPAMLNHPGYSISLQEVVDSQGKGADAIEARDRNEIGAWDGILSQGRQIIASWSSDTNQGFNAGWPATYIYAPALDFDELMHSLFEGRVFNGYNHSRTRTAFNLDSASQAPYPARYPVYVSDALPSADVHLSISTELSSGHLVRWIRNGALLLEERPTRSSYDSTKSVPLDGPITYVRAEALSTATTYWTTTQAIFFIDINGMPTDKRFSVERITTPDGRGYTLATTKGITAASWGAAEGTLALGLENPPGSLVQIGIASASAPQSLSVDGVALPAAASLAAYEAAPDSAWYYDGVARRLALKVRHGGANAEAQVAFGPPTDPPTPGPTNTPTSTSASSSPTPGPTNTPTSTSASSSPTPSPSSPPTSTPQGPSPSSTPTSTPQGPSQILFEDGFEGGDMARWSRVTRMVAQQQELYTGDYGAQATGAGVTSYAYWDMSQTRGELYYRVRFKILSQGPDSLFLLMFRTQSGAALQGIYVTSGGKLGYQNYVVIKGLTSSTTVTRGAWHELQVRLRVDGAAGQSEIWYDGARVASLSQTDNFGTTPIGRIQLGETIGGRTFDMAFDDVVVSDAYIQP